MRVLVVEDESVIRHLIDRLLTRSGHHVITAPDPIEASALLLDYEHPIDVALIDVSLPRMSGTEYADRLRRQFPSVRVLFMTGHVEEERLLEAEQRAPLLLKPFTREQLLASISPAS